jgi:hypothetical protein
MATTTNFGWVTPDNTDLVKDGAAAIRTLGSSIDSTMGELKGGTTGQVLSKTTGTDMDFTWVTTDDTNAIQNAIVDAKGDLIAASAADTPARLAVGSNFGWLRADSSTATGLAWDDTGWTSYTPTVTAGSGTFTTVSATGNSKRIGKTVFVEVIITITTNGTAATNIQFTLPYSGTGQQAGVFREGAVTGNCGIITNGGTGVIMRTFTNGYPGGTGYVLAGSLIYQVA